ncbi:MAG: CsgG/HfaB family protein [Planctomycetota bacterium]|jgi:curli biogenesis system outer membrane secretion channel CsgG
MNFKDALLVGAAVLTLGVGCANPQAPDDEPDYQTSTVTTEPIMGIQPPFFGQTLAIAPFVNKSLSEYRTLGDIAPDVLVEFAINGGWQPIEGQRGQLDVIAEELDFGQTEYVNPQTAAQIGNMLGARYVLIGAVTNFKITKTRGKDGWDFLGIVGQQGNESVLVYECQVAGRVVDVQTRAIVGARTESVKQVYRIGGKKTQVLGVKVESGETVEVERDSLGKVLRLAFSKMLNGIHTQVNMRAAQMRAPQQSYQQPPPPAYQPTQPPAANGY